MNNARRSPGVLIPASYVGSDMSRLWKQLTPRRRLQFWALVAFMVVGALAEVATLGAIVPFLALLSQSGKTSCDLPAFLCRLDLVQASALFAAMAAAATAVRISLLWSSNRFTYGLGADLGGEVFERLLRQPYTYHVASNTSEAIAGINKVNHVVHSVLQPLMQGFVAMVLAASIMTGLIWIDARSAIAALLLFGTLYVGASAVGRRVLRRNGRIISDCEGQRIQSVQEGLGGIRDILIDGTQEIYTAKFNVTNARQRRAQAANAFVRLAPRYVIEGVGMILMVLLALWIYERDGFTQAIPVLGALALGSQKLLPQLQQIYTSWASVNGNRGMLHDVLSLLELQASATIDNDSFAPVPAGSSDSNQSPALIELRDASFAYQKAGTLVLKRLNLSIQKGERVGFIGKTGSGKSTLIDIVMGLLPLTEGSMHVDGRPLMHGDVRGWQRRLAHVPQAIYLSDASLAENIAFGVPTNLIDMARVLRAAEQSQLAHFIDGLKDGYRTTVGERGVRLSGGQRQRIGLARALYKQADVLVLDEATSALDNQTEDAIMTAINELQEGITILVVAHRLSTLRGCTRVIEIDAGRISRIGTYEDIVSG